MTPALSYQYGPKNSVIYSQFEQLSIIPTVSLLLTFNKYKASVCLFRYNIFIFQNIISQSEHKFASEYFEKK